MTASDLPITWNLGTDGHYTSTDNRFIMYPERRPENDGRLTWTLLDADGAEGGENGFDTHAEALDTAVRLATERIHEYADKIVTLVHEDKAEGVVPADVHTFTDLHDHVDANMYLEHAGQKWEWTTPASWKALVDQTNAITDEVTRRLTEETDTKEGAVCPT